VTKIESLAAIKLWQVNFIIWISVFSFKIFFN
jgi:hypothetical protein